MHCRNKWPLLGILGVTGKDERRNILGGLHFRGPPVISLHVGLFSGAQLPEDGAQGENVGCLGAMLSQKLFGGTPGERGSIRTCAEWA
jgi:hypothetical protein